MEKLYMGSVQINWWKMSEVIGHFIIKERLTFSEFLMKMGEDKKNTLSSATYYAWIRRGRMRVNYIKRMEELGINVDWFII